jgi:hypothetical protein
MKVYGLLPIENLELCKPDDWEGFDKLGASGATSVDWRPFSVRIVHWSEGRKRGYSDAPWWGSHVLIFRKEAAERLEPYLKAFRELLPLECEETPLVAFRGTRLIDALSPDSSAERFDDGSIMILWTAVFKESVLKGQDIFKLPDFRISPMFVGEGFVKKWKESGLTGLEFDEVWDSAKSGSGKH